VHSLSVNDVKLIGQLESRSEKLAAYYKSLKDARDKIAQLKE
jgi:hypothetical protein